MKWQSITLFHSIYTVDPWTTWVWIVQVHLYVDFFNKYILQYYTIWGWLNPRLWNHLYRGPTVKLHADFQLCSGLAPLTPTLFRGQLYLLCARQCSGPCLHRAYILEFLVFSGYMPRSGSAGSYGNLFIYFWLHWVFVAAHRLFSSCGERGLLFVVCGLLTAVASLVAEHGL